MLEWEIQELSETDMTDRGSFATRFSQGSPGFGASHHEAQPKMGALDSSLSASPPAGIDSGFLIDAVGFSV